MVDKTINTYESLRLFLRRVRQKNDKGLVNYRKEVNAKFQTKKGISIVTACKDREFFLRKTIKTWDLPEVSEIIIVDWDSRVPVKKYFLKHLNSKIKVLQVENQKRWHLTKAYNLGVKFASYDKILKIDSDIILEKNFFQKHLLEKATFFCGNYKKARNDNERHINGTSFFYKEDFLFVNGYNETINSYGWDDSDFYLRLEKVGILQKDLNADLLYHMAHGDNLRLQHQPEVKDVLIEIAKNKQKFEFSNFAMSKYKIIPDLKYPWLYEGFEINDAIEDDFENNAPLVSIITSVYKGEKYIAEFLKDITRQTIFSQCELILINPNSPENEEKIIKEYIKKYENIRYIRLLQDPGLYECWNIAIKLARGKYITNANLDDRRAKSHIEEHVRVLEKDRLVSAVSAPLLVTENINETFENNSAKTKWFVGFPEYFDGDNMFCLDNETKKVNSQNILHCMPVWRKDLHEANGYFDEEVFGASADWEFWLRCSKNGARFKLLPNPLGLYLLDKNSHNRRFVDTLQKENLIVSTYYRKKTKLVDALISKEKKFIYVNNPKVACSSIKFDIGKAMGFNDQILNSWNRGEKDSGSDTLNYTTINLLDLEYQNYFKFSFVRNPWDRIASCYENKININKREDILSAQNVFNFFKKDNISFNEFAVFLAQEKEEFSDPHWRSQHDLLFSGDKKCVDFVGRFENLDVDFKFVADKLKINAALPHLVYTEKKYYADFYNLESKNKVRERYKKEIETFGYKFENKNGNRQ